MTWCEWLLWFCAGGAVGFPVGFFGAWLHDHLCQLVRARAAAMSVLTEHWVLTLAR
jgi:hypothetical protein